VFRKEVFLEIQAQNLEAAESSKEALDQALGMMGEADEAPR
jgi:sRNA-binding carbon storage regulator CsrA